IRALEIEEKNRAKEIIEDFMIAVNGATARYLSASGFPSIRRVVRTPKRWERIVEIAREHKFELPDIPDSKALEEFLVKEKAADPLRFPDLSLAVVKLLGSDRTDWTGVRAKWWSPPALDPAQQATLKAAVQTAPSVVGLDLAKWTWKWVRQFVQERFDCLLSSRTCLNYLHRLGFVLKRPKKRLCKANAERRAAFVQEYVALRAEAQVSGARIFFVDEAHFRADVELRRQWVLRGEPALVDSTSPRFGEKATYYSAVCLETGEVLALPVEGNTTAETSVAFLQQLREKYSGLLIVIWDNGPAHRGDAMRAYLSTPDLKLRLVALPAYSPDFNPDEAIWDWVREEVTANTCFGTATKVREKVDAFIVGLAARTAEVMQRCRRKLQAQADQLLLIASQASVEIDHVDLIVRSV
ncbi:MAG: IS630 family transposase, partial [Chloroflexota bacterium]|nr:IS630 family transposase [Chloroflexota bacterium]